MMMPPAGYLAKELRDAMKVVLIFYGIMDVILTEWSLIFSNARVFSDLTLDLAESDSILVHFGNMDYY